MKQAMRFVQLLPRRYADTRTYNMLVTVCGAAGDVTSALHAADMLRSTGGKPDTIMYTNLIAGALSHPDVEYVVHHSIYDCEHKEACGEVIDVCRNRWLRGRVVFTDDDVIKESSGKLR